MAGVIWRMCFASIRIFTLGLPWRLGADFLYRHLLEGDAASNRLGWRWVAGLHTRGKPCPAEAQNIATFAAGRFVPRPGDLAEGTQGSEATEPDGLPSVLPLRAVISPEPGAPTARLITDEDCRVEDFDLASLDIRALATLPASHLRSPLPVSDLVTRFATDALADAALRVGVAPVAQHAGDPAALAKWAAGAGATQIATPYVTRGPLRDGLDQAAPSLAKAGSRCANGGVTGTARSGPMPPPGSSMSGRTSPAFCTRCCLHDAARPPHRPPDDTDPRGLTATRRCGAQRAGPVHGCFVPHGLCGGCAGDDRGDVFWPEQKPWLDALA